MTHKRNPMTQEQLDEVRRRHRNREPMSKIARSFKVRPDWLKCLIDPEFNERRCKSRRESARRRRKEKRKLPPILHPSVRDVVIVPREVLFDRATRERAPMSLSAMFFGDPPQGYSALEGKGR
jgi:hypothetical protein